MCKTETTVIQPSTSCFAKHNNSTCPLQQRRKRAHDGHSSSNTIPRSAKRVTFSTENFVLGQAQAYDRRGTVRQPTTVCLFPSSQHTRSQPTTTTMSAAEGTANFCGMWRRSHGFNWAALLELSGVDNASIPEQMARIQASSVVHLIDHDDTSFRLVVHSDSGNTQDQHFFIGGQPRPISGTVGGANNSNSSTLASMRWANNGQALVLTSVDAASGDEMTVSRHLASQESVMVQHYRARCARTGETAEAVTIFRRMARRSDSDESTGSA